MPTRVRVLLAATDEGATVVIAAGCGSGRHRAPHLVTWAARA
ncbi:MAG TPA: hypothetical protein VFH94_24280 [Streptomyces sp.]|nr:hypothetical protein [Streptomyces sp.]